jgi:hypothetical protein
MTAKVAYTTALRTSTVFAQPPHDVFDVDHRVVDHHADGDGETAERHRVEGDAEPLQHQRCGEQRKRNGGAGDRRRPQVEEKEEQDDDHQHAAQDQGVANVRRRRNDEIRRPEKIGLERNSIRRKARPQVFERRLQSVGHVERVGAVLFRDVEDDAGAALDSGAPDRGLGRHHHVGDIAQPHTCGAAADQDRAANFRGFERLPFGLEDDALVHGVDKAGAAHPGGVLRRLEHVVEREVVADEFARMDLDLDRALFGAEYRDAGNARDREQAQADGPVGKGAQIHQGARS